MPRSQPTARRRIQVLVTVDLQHPSVPDLGDALRVAECLAEVLRQLAVAGDPNARLRAELGQRGEHRVVAVLRPELEHGVRRLAVRETGLLLRGANTILFATPSGKPLGRIMR